MCGIWSFIELIKTTKSVNYGQLFNDFMNMKPRGPDFSSFQTLKNVSFGFHRLAVMDPTFHANQPYIIEDGERTIVFLCNGEIYNFKEIISKFKLDITTNADCLTIPKLYLKYVKSNPTGYNNIDNFTLLFNEQIKGEYAFVLFEFDKLQNLKEIVIGRDHVGVRPLYIGMEQNETAYTSMMLSSEIKGMLTYEGVVKEFPPGTIMHYHLDDFGTIVLEDPHNFKTLYDIVPHDERVFINPEEKEYEYLYRVRDVVIASVKRRLVADKPIAFLLSGGVDSSLVASISTKLLGTKIRTFCCGMKGGTDLKYARMVADHIGSNHTEVIFTPEEGLNKIREVIRLTETHCVTSIRASIGQNIVCEYISKNTDAKVVLVGEGADEVCSSYLTNWYAPSGAALHETALEYLRNIHLYDGRRVDRNVSNYGLEARVALLDPQFIETYFSIPAEWRRPQTFGIEKYFLRQAFKESGILPDEILERKKEAFSDGMSSTEKSWFQILQEHIETLVSDQEFANNKWDCVTKEQYYYKKVFCEFFGEKRLDIIPGSWLPKWDSNGNVVIKFIDPSARTLKIYKDSQFTDL
jgi:asparagine synthase (glutamine-hydrolysing)